MEELQPVALPPQPQQQLNRQEQQQQMQLNRQQHQQQQQNGGAAKVAAHRLEEYCGALGGSRPIHSVLISNNGMAAVKFIRSVRSWAYETFGSERAVLLVAMATPEDMRINAEHIRMADQFVEVGGGSNNNNYANVRLIAEVAERTGVGAVWPGWGHASENPELPAALSARNIVFLGPHSTAMAALGDKIGSSLIAQAAGVPTLPWSGSKVEVPFETCQRGGIPQQLYDQACVFTTEEALAVCQQVGYPAMIKASWGGGGKGIRKVHNGDEVEPCFKQVQGEVPGSPVFIMKVASQCRHLEVQLLCDQHGNVAALHSRDCSVQRRHQKIIEEGPITIAPPHVVHELEQGARRLAKCVNYVGAATVEYLYSMDTGEFYFLELNPRLQVEHPVTEWIAEINLPAAQLCVGMGIPLWKMPEVRRFYGKEAGGGINDWHVAAKVATSFDFDTTPATKAKGHVVAVRVTSEDPDDGFKPTTGKVQELSFRSKPNVWAYFSVKSGGGIHEFSDSQFGHVFAFGETRPAAIANMVLGLKELHIRGEIRTNIDYSVDLLHAPEYRDNRIHTGWLDSRIAMRVRTEKPQWYISVVCGAIYRTSRLAAGRVSEYIGYLEKGQIPPKNISLVTFNTSLNIDGIKYTMRITKGGPGSYRLNLNGSQVDAEVHTLRDGGLLVQLDGNSHVVYGEEEAAGTRVLIDGRTCLLQNDHDPSRLVAETPCKLVRFLVPDGSHVDIDSPYAEVEVMKMCMPLLSPASGTIRFRLSEGHAMAAGDLIASLDLDDPSAVRKAVPYKDKFPSLGKPIPVAGRVHHRFASSVNTARMVLAGYEHNVDEVVQGLLSCLDDPQLPLLQWQESMAVLAARLPKDLKSELDIKLGAYEASKQAALDFPAKTMRSVLENFLASISDKERGAQERLVEPLMNLAKSYEGGRKGHACFTVKSLFDEYLSVEELFSQSVQADVIENLRHQHKKDLSKVVDMVLSHQGLKMKNNLVLRLMEALVYPDPGAYREQLARFAVLSDTSYSQLALRASLLLEQSKLSGIRADVARSLSELEMFIEEGNTSLRSGKSAIDERMEYWVDAPVAVEDALVALFDHGEHGDHTLQRRVIETYVRRLYQPYLVKGSIRMQWQRAAILASWQFREEEPLRTFDEVETLVPAPNKNVVWRGAMVILASLNYLSSTVRSALEESFVVSDSSNALAAAATSRGNVLHVALVGLNNQMSGHQDSGDEDQAQERVEKLAKGLKSESMRALLQSAGVGIVSCIIQRDEGRGPIRHCFHWSEETQSYAEDPLFRHIEPPLSNFLELEKLGGFPVMQYSLSRDRQWHLYSAPDKKDKRIQRLFLRTFVRRTRSVEAMESVVRALQGALEELELSNQGSKGRAEHVHVYLCILRAQEVSKLASCEEEEDVLRVVASGLQAMAQRIHSQLGARMYRLAVASWELRVFIECAGVGNGAWRVIVSNATGCTCSVHVYMEAKEPVSQQPAYMSPLPSSRGPLHGVALSSQYKPLDVLDTKRVLARRNNTTYCYDFPSIFSFVLEQERQQQQEEWEVQEGEALVEARELVLEEGERLVETQRAVASNDIGMVAWRMKLRTLEYPGGRELLVVANDVTHQAGSFGPREDAFFKAVTDAASHLGLPLIYLAANSGARIGIAEEVRAAFRVAWADPARPHLGFHYLYLSPADYARLGPASVRAHRLRLPKAGGAPGATPHEQGATQPDTSSDRLKEEEDGMETRWVIDDVIGAQDGLGVENLSGSGAIAAAYARAYRETFTLTYVSGRTVGIGAYLARLGVRCIQRLDQPIILTGFSALNKLLGREVYSSQMQLGGPKVMATNGVTHITVNDDAEGVRAILTWVAYVPHARGAPLPRRRCRLPLEAAPPAEAYRPETSCEPRAAIGALFDSGSFVETLEGWARTVVTGRARLAGVPCGVIAVETAAVVQTIPADPGQPESQERLVPQAGQVWFPDSAAKTAQALADLNAEGLPLFILANWRGFSGGQRDLFDGVLQAGSTIVEHLRLYAHPVFVYLPRTAELRGGAWVVIDRAVNPRAVEMYADPTARAGVLEAEGVAEIKFRSQHLLDTMKRLDPQLAALQRQLEHASAAARAAPAAAVVGQQQQQQQQQASSSSEAEAAALEVKRLQQQLRARAELLTPVYKQIALRFIDMHDTAQRLVAKGIIRRVVEWDEARPFFAARLQRRLAEDALAARLAAAAGLPRHLFQAAPLLRRCFHQDVQQQQGEEDEYEDDHAFLRWAEQHAERRLQPLLQQLERDRLCRALLDAAGGAANLASALPVALRSLLHQVDAATKREVMAQLSRICSEQTEEGEEQAAAAAAPQVAAAAAVQHKA